MHFERVPLRHIRSIEANSHGINSITYGGPRNFADIEELVITSNDDAVLFPPTSPAMAYLSCEQTTSESRKWGRDVVVFELVHLPALNGHLWDIRGYIVRALD